MEKSAPSRSETLLKWVSLVSLVLSAAWTLYTYGVDRAKQQNQSIFERQTALYFEASRNAAILATSSDDLLRKTADERFNELFFGELVVVEDRRIELAMIAFRNCKNSKPFDPDNEDKPSELATQGHLQNAEEDRDCSRARADENGHPLAESAIRKLSKPTLPNLSLELSACIRTALEQNRGILFSNRVEPKTTCPYN